MPDCKRCATARIRLRRSNRFLRRLVAEPERSGRLLGISPRLLRAARDAGDVSPAVLAALLEAADTKEVYDVIEVTHVRSEPR